MIFSIKLNIVAYFENFIFVNFIICLVVCAFMNTALPKLKKNCLINRGMQGTQLDSSCFPI